MSTHSLKPSPVKRLALCTVSVLAAAVLFALPQTQQVLPFTVPTVQAAETILRPAAMLIPGHHDFWHTEGNRILDSHDHPVRISGMNWSGFETRQSVPGGLDAQDYRAILRTIKSNGYNTVRIPFSNEMVEMPTVPDHISFQNSGGPINTDLRNLTSLEILDHIVTYSGKIGLKVILDNHRSDAGSSAEESGLWYTPQFPEAAWVEDWTALAHRYQNTSTVIGVDLRNEPHNADRGGACWDCGGQNDWHTAAQRAGNAVLAVNPRLLIFVEGVDSYAGDTYWWGGNLEGVRRSPVHLSIPNRLVYSAHEYGPTEYSQPWFNTSTSPATLASIWRRHWAFISESGIAPVWIGEFGTSNNDTDVQNSVPGSEGQWFQSLITFFGSHPALGWTYWGVNGEDRYGLLDTSYSSSPASQAKSEALASISGAAVQVPAPATTSGELATYPTVPRTFAQPSIVAVAVPSHSLEAEHDKVEAGHNKRATRNDALNTDTSVESTIAASVHHAVSTANLKLATNSGDLNQ